MPKLFDINTFNIYQNYGLEASAGTGKTYNIIEILKKYTQKDENGKPYVDLTKILIVTYTEKAAGELKDRIRKEIDGDVDNASIGTIHSFCQNTIKEFAVSANLPIGLTLVDDNYIYDFADRYIREGEILEEIKEVLLYHCKEEFKPSTISETLVALSNRYYLDSSYSEDEEVVVLLGVEEARNRIEKAICLSKATDFNELCFVMPDIGEAYQILSNSKNKKVLDNLKKVVSTYNETRKLSGFNRRTAMTDEEKEANEVLYAYKDIEKSLEKDIALCHLKAFFTALQHQKEIDKVQTFDDMIRAVREAVLVPNSVLKAKLKEKYSHAIIDEFQDTNKRQFDIFYNIFMDDDEHHIVVVGDPKQSIYSFQGADINVYYKAIKEIEKKGVICSLNKNFRSSNKMVNSCNKLFKHFSFKGTTFEDTDSLNVNNGDKAEHSFLYDGKVTNSFWVIDVHNDAEKKISDKMKEEFAKASIQIIVNCCEKPNGKDTRLKVKSKDDNEYRNVSFKDFAVLAKSRSEFLEIERELKKVGIPFIKYKDTNLFNDVESSHWAAIFEAIDQTDFTGDNRIYLRRALATKFFSLNLLEINDSRIEKDDIEEVRLIEKWKSLAEAHLYEELVDDILLSSNISNNLSSLSDIQSFSKYKQIGNFIVEYLSNNHTVHELVSTLYRGGSEDEEADTTIEKSTNFDCVQLMTCHASKGLQFPVAIIPAGAAGKNNNIPISSYHIDNPDGASTQALTNSNTDEAKNESVEELKRLFYVAYTRAQFVQVIPFYGRDCFTDKCLGDAIADYMENNSNDYNVIKYKPYDISSFKETVKDLLNSNVKDDDNNDSSLNEQNKVLKDLISSSGNKLSYKHSYSSLSHGKENDDSNNDVDSFEKDKEGQVVVALSSFDINNIQIVGNYDNSLSPIELPISYPKGARLGDALHNVMELSNFTKFDLYSEPIIKRCFFEGGISLDEERLKATKEMLSTVLKAELPIIEGNKQKEGSFRLSDIENKDKKAEVEFDFNLLDDRLKNYCNGFIDLLFRRGEYYSILDWKSDKLNEDFLSYSDPKELKKHVDEHYSIQRVLYSYCLINWLKCFYPNLSEQEIFESHFGGIYYLFFRGCNENTMNGVYAQTWENYSELKKSFDHIVKTKLGGKYHA